MREKGESKCAHSVAANGVSTLTHHTHTAANIRSTTDSYRKYIFKAIGLLIGMNVCMDVSAE